MQGMDICVLHQFREGNQAIDFLAKQGELGSNVFYDDLQQVSRFLKGVIWIDKVGLPSIRIEGCFICFIFACLYEFFIMLNARLEFHLLILGLSSIFFFSFFLVWLYLFCV